MKGLAKWKTECFLWQMGGKIAYAHSRSGTKIVFY